MQQSFSGAAIARVERTFINKRRVESEHKRPHTTQSIHKNHKSKKPPHIRRQRIPDERHIFAWSFGLATLGFFNLAVPSGYLLVAFALLLVAGGVYKRRYLTMNGWNWTIIPSFHFSRRHFFFSLLGLSIIILGLVFPVILPYVLIVNIALCGFWVFRQAIMIFRKDGTRRNPLTKPDSAFWNHWTGKRWNTLGYYLQALMLSTLLAIFSFRYISGASLFIFNELIILEVVSGVLLACCVLFLEAGKRVLGNDNNREAEKQAAPNFGGKSDTKFLTHKIDRLVVICLAALVLWFLFQILTYGVLGPGIAGMFAW